MSTRNVSLCREAIQAFNVGGTEALVPYYAENCQIYDPDLPGDGTHHGHDGLRRFVANFTDGFEEIQAFVEELIPAGDRVIGLTRTYGRGLDGTEIEIRDAHTWTFTESGKIAYWRVYLNREEALSDAGLAGTGELGPAPEPA